MRNNNNSIIYVNFAPYENTGNILTYLLSKFDTVAMFSFTFYDLGKKNLTSTLSFYKYGKCLWSKNIIQLIIPHTFVFIFLPIRSCILFLQLIYHIVLLRMKYGTFNTYFTVNAFTAWCGNIIKNMGLVKKTIFWVWDYYPPIHKNKIVMFMRSIYWMFDKAAITSDRVVFLNNRLLSLRRTIGILPKGKEYPIVGIGTVICKRKKQQLHTPLRLAYLGTVKQSQGLDFIFDNAEEIIKKSDPFEVHVFGGGPDEERFKRRARNCPIRFIFHGYIPDSTTLQNKLALCDIGIALYMPDPANVSYYGDPSKIKAYISLGIPVITTNVFWFANEIKKKHVGFVIPYDQKIFADSLNKIKRNYSFYSNQAYALAATYNYKNLYETIFT